MRSLACSLVDGVLADAILISPHPLLLPTDISIEWVVEKVWKLEKWFPLQGERAHCLKFFVCTIRGLRYQKQNRMEEETEPQT